MSAKITGIPPSAARVRQVALRLSKRYGNPRLHNKDDPLDELVFIVLSAKTTERSYLKTYAALRTACPDWLDVLSTPPMQVRRLIKGGGLSAKKERQLRAILRQLRRGGAIDLATFLRKLDDGAAERFLEGLPGIGRKSAKCILMYSMDRKLFPVDTHVARIFDRLGWVPRRRLTDSVQDAIEQLVPPSLRYDLHVNMVAHGRTTCTTLSPRCASCAVRELCDYYAKARTSAGR
jgi:endonuclease III